MKRSMRLAPTLVLAMVTAGLAFATSAAADTSGAPVPTGTPVCYTFFPSGGPSGASTDSGGATVSAAPPTGSAVAGDSGVASDTGAPTDTTDTAVPSDTGGASDTGVPTDSAVPSDTAVATDTGTGGATDTAQPSGPVTACAEADSGGGAGSASSPARDPLAESGSDTALLAGVAAALLALGVAISVGTARVGRTRRSH